MTLNAIEVENLTKRFGSFTAVDAISFHVEPGEIFGFLGANGAGKTTAMKMLCGLSKPTSGSGRVAGYDITRHTECIKRNIGYMMQKFAMYPQLTVDENLRLAAQIHGMGRKEITAESERLYTHLEMFPIVDKRVNEIPVGWRQKLAFAAATIHRPKVLFLDEPTGGVDPVTRRRFWELIYEEARQGMSVFVTTHYLDEAEYCRRVSIMVDGRIAALDSPGNLKAKYGEETMDAVFRTVAANAQRQE